jgi:hypothetical protein
MIPAAATTEHHPDAIDNDWVIEQHDVRIVGIKVGPILPTSEIDGLKRVTETGRWIYTGAGWQEQRLAEEHGLEDLPRFRQGQRFTLDSAIRKLHVLKMILPGITFRARNAVTGDIILAHVV